MESAGPNARAVPSIRIFPTSAMLGVRAVVSHVPKRAVSAAAPNARVCFARYLSSSRAVCEAPKSTIASLQGQIRKERDTFGDLEVPADKYWGAQTQRYVAYLTQLLAELPHRW